MKFFALVTGLLLFSFVLVGCNRRPTIQAPNFNSGAIAAKAMELIDQDNDGFLTKEELLASPGLLDGMRTVDMDGDERISSDEIKVWMDELIASKNACQIVNCQVKRNGKPVVGATIRFEPEPFIADFITGAEDTTDGTGSAAPVSPEVPFGIRPGFYRVLITGDTIPARYNSETILGAEVSGRSRGDEVGCYFFELE